MSDQATVWVFVSANARFPGGVFSSRERASGWIGARKLTGMLTEYPVDIGAYEAAIANGWFRPRKPDHESPSFIGSFTSARMAHVHFENGEEVG